MDALQFGARLRELRVAAGLTQRQLAERLCANVGWLSRLEGGIQEPPFSTALALAEVLGVDLAAFLKPPAPAPRPRRGRPPKTAVQRPGALRPDVLKGRPAKEPRHPIRKGRK